jgi:hypothetical protein
VVGSRRAVENGARDDEPLGVASRVRQSGLVVREGVGNGGGRSGRIAALADCTPAE